MSEYEINILPFSILHEQVGFSFSAKEKEGYFRTYINNLPKNLPTEFQEVLAKICLVVNDFAGR